MKRDEILETAQKLISGDRAATYGGCCNHDGTAKNSAFSWV